MGKEAACAFVAGLGRAFPTLPNDVKGVLCPSFPLLGTLSLPASFSLGAQTCSSFDQGAYTGEVSASLLKEIGCQYVIVGHSERRVLFGESNAVVRDKALQVLTHRMIPILCVGEPLDVYERGEAKAFLEQQLAESLPPDASLGDFILAYEPLWAIGTGRVASVEDIQEIHGFLRGLLDAHGLTKTSIVYGGSVTPENAPSILALSEVSGVLVGGASLALEKFSIILRGI
jgi:triosephosphate isomerase